MLGMEINAADRVLADIREIAPYIASRVAQMEACRRMPLNLVNELKSIGAFRMCVPRSHGGLELDLPDVLKVIGALGNIDGSVGWTVMIASGSSIVGPLLGRDIYDRIYKDGPDAVLGGSVTPAGTAEATEGGYLVSGRWPFASGCQHTAALFGFCVMTENGKRLPGPAGEAGPPMIRGFYLPTNRWQIEDTWHAAGLKGTGSHHISVSKTVVPAENFFDPMTAESCVPGPLYRALRQTLPLLHGSNSIGIAEAALEELVALANTGRQQLRATVPLRDSELFQCELGRLEADLRAAKALLHAQAESHWNHALAGTLKTEALLTQATQTAIWIVTTCTRIADACFALGGGSALYESSPLQRRMRDLHVAAQHMVAQPRFYVNAGKELLNKSAA